MIWIKSAIKKIIRYNSIRKINVDHFINVINVKNSQIFLYLRKIYQLLKHCKEKRLIPEAKGVYVLLKIKIEE